MTSRSLFLLLLSFVCALALACGETFVGDDDTTWYGEDDDATGDDDTADDDTADDDTAGDDDDDATFDPDNEPPVADAGATVFIELGTVAQLDGSASYDPDGDTLTFLWELTSQPPNGAALLANAESAVAVLDPTIPGVHHMELTVTDPGGLEGSDEVSVWVESGNLAPYANAGVDQTVTQGDAVQLDGSGSYDPNGDPLTYLWVPLSYPGANPPALSNTGDPMPNYVAIDSGSYVFELTVDDGEYTSTPDDVTIVATASGDDDDGCFGCYAYMPGDVHPEPLRLSLTPAPTAGRPHALPALGLLALVSVLTLVWHRRRG